NIGTTRRTALVLTVCGARVRRGRRRINGWPPLEARDLPLILQRVNRPRHGGFEYLWRLVRKRFRPESRGWRKRNSDRAIRKSRQLGERSDAGPRRISQQFHDASQRCAPHRSAYVRLVRRPLVVESEHIGDVRPHLQPHKSEIVTGWPPLRQR